MKYVRRSPWIALLIGICALPACKPKFTATGTLQVDGVSFVPASCQVLTSHNGIALLDGAGARIDLVVSSHRPEAFKTVTATPSLTFTAPGTAPVSLGPCGTLTLTGEGYHGEGKRAVSGQADLTCSAAVSVTGTLSFEGCF